MRSLLLALLGAAVLLAAPASAHPIDGDVDPLPMCDAVPVADACLGAWYSLDPEGWLDCPLGATPLLECFPGWCTLDWPPSHCRLVFADYGFRG